MCLSDFRIIVCAVGLLCAPLYAEVGPPYQEGSPSQEKIRWTRAKTSYEFMTEYDYLAGANADLGNGQQGNIREHFTRVQQIVSRRCLRAFLLQMGVEWEHFSFNPPSGSLIPGQLDAMNGLIGVDFRWSQKDMFHIHTHPGFYTDFQNVPSDFNMPIEAAYVHLVSRNFQWALGLSYNPLRDVPLLPGGGFRYQMTDRWKLKFLLPKPQVEYKACEDLHVFVGGDFRGDTFRVGKHFGDDRNNSSLNDALLDYREIRVGAGFSWNIRPLIELNMESGYLVDRQFNYHNNGIIFDNRGTPYVSLNLHILFELWAPGEERINQDIDVERQLQIPILQEQLKGIFQ